jgi:hypothetical protein
MAFRTAVVFAGFLIGLGGLARESFAQYYRRKHTRRLGIIHLRDISRLRQLMTMMHRCRLVITICRPPVDPTPAQPVLVKSIPWRPD